MFSIVVHNVLFSQSDVRGDGLLHELINGFDTELVEDDFGVLGVVAQVTAVEVVGGLK